MMQPARNFAPAMMITVASLCIFAGKANAQVQQQERIAVAQHLIDQDKSSSEHWEITDDQWRIATQSDDEASLRADQSEAPRTAKIRIMPSNEWIPGPDSPAPASLMRMQPRVIEK